MSMKPFCKRSSFTEDMAMGRHVDTFSLQDEYHSHTVPASWSGTDVPISKGPMFKKWSETMWLTGIPVLSLWETQSIRSQLQRSSEHTHWPEGGKGKGTCPIFSNFVGKNSPLSPYYIPTTSLWLLWSVTIRGKKRLDYKSRRIKMPSTPVWAASLITSGRLSVGLCYGVFVHPLVFWIPCEWSYK